MTDTVSHNRAIVIPVVSTIDTPPVVLPTVLNTDTPIYPPPSVPLASDPVAPEGMKVTHKKDGSIVFTPAGGRPKGARNLPKKVKVDRAMVAREAEKERWFQAVINQEADLSDIQWQALMTKTLMTIVKNPGPHGAASLAAMKAMDVLREKRKMGSEEAVRGTLKACSQRMEELRALEQWARQQGVSATTKAGNEHPAGEQGSKAES